MGDHFALLVNRLITESTLHAAIESRNRQKQTASVLHEADEVDITVQKGISNSDGSSSGKLVECRICQEEDFDTNLETPCSCSGSLKFAHRRCIQKWCNEKRDTICEICHQKFEPGYTAPPSLIQYGRVPLFLRRNWHISRRELNNSDLRGMVSTEEDADSDIAETSSRTLRYLTVSIIFIVLLVLRHTLPIIINGTAYCVPTYVLVGLKIVAVAFLLCAILLAATAGKRTCHCLNGSDDDESATSSEEEGEDQPEQQQLSHVIQVDRA